MNSGSDAQVPESWYLDATEKLTKIRQFTELEWEASPTSRGNTPRDTFIAVQDHIRSVLDGTA